LQLYARLIVTTRELERQRTELRRGQLADAAGDLLNQVREINGIKLLTARMDGVDAKALRELSDKLRERLGAGVLCLGSSADGKASLLITVSKELTERVQAGKLVQELAPLMGGKGGGRPELAQAGGNNPAALQEIFDRLTTILQSR